VLAIRLIS